MHKSKLEKNILGESTAASNGNFYKKAFQGQRHCSATVPIRSPKTNKFRDESVSLKCMNGVSKALPKKLSRQFIQKAITLECTQRLLGKRGKYFRMCESQAICKASKKKKMKFWLQRLVRWSQWLLQRWKIFPGQQKLLNISSEKYKNL